MNLSMYEWLVVAMVLGENLPVGSIVTTMVREVRQGVSI